MPTVEFSIKSLKNPAYTGMFPEWEKWRITYEGGQQFIESYLHKLSIRETDDDFAVRKHLTYCPAFAAAAVDEIKDSIFQRAIDITRVGGTDSYIAAIDGADGGVDLTGSSMNSFVGRIILPELLTMQRVGIFVDMPPVVEGGSLLQNQGKRPYIYIYRAEDIVNWVYDDSNNPNEFRKLLLKECKETYDPNMNLPIGYADQYRMFELTDSGVLMTLYSSESQVVDSVLLPIKFIPFVMSEISHSLLKNTANYQIGLLNLASTDINFCVKANFSFYTEQYDPMAMSEWLKKPDNTKDGSAAGSTPAKTEEIHVGVTAGRKYPKNLDRPDFIHPSAEPLTASMAKQEQMKQEIRELVKLSVSSLQPRTASAESKKIDSQSLESGLSYIGLELEHTERKIAFYWSMYESSSKIATIKYPERYSLMSETERREESNGLLKLRGAVPSKKYQREISKRVADVTIGHRVSSDALVAMYNEIDTADAIEFDSAIIQIDLEGGLVSKELASKIRGYPDGEATKAKEDRVEELKQVALAQSQAAGRVPGATTTPQDNQNAKDLIAAGQLTGATDGSKMGGKQ